MIRTSFYSAFLILFASLALHAAPRLGTDFGMLDNPMPVKKDGKVEVVEAFWYGHTKMPQQPLPCHPF